MWGVSEKMWQSVTMGWGRIAVFLRYALFEWPLINKGMCDLLFDVFKYLLLRKTVVLKKNKFVGKENLKKCISSEEQKGTM